DDLRARETIQRIFWEALRESDNSIAGTALLGLFHLSREMPSDFDEKSIARAALQLAGGDGVGELSRITAFQICARLNLPGALPAIWQAARSGETVPLQISAISALGALGDGQAKPFLN